MITKDEGMEISILQEDKAVGIANDQITVALQQGLQQGAAMKENELQPQINKQAAKILSTQIRQNYRKFKDVFSKCNNGIVPFKPSKCLRDVNLARIQEALRPYQQDKAYEYFIGFIKKTGVLPETDMTDNSYGD